MASQLVSSTEAQEIAAEVKTEVEKAAVETEEFCIQMYAAAEARANEILAERERVKKRERRAKSWLARLFG